MTREDSGPAAHSDERRERWDRRYAEAHHTDHCPNAEVERIVDGWTPGRALDLGAGSGRHAIWLAERGWEVTAVDFSETGTRLGEQAAADRGLTVEWVVADARTWAPAKGAAFDLVLLSYLHLPQSVIGRTADWLAPGGHLVVVGHALRNLTDGVGGPSNPDMLYTVDGLRAAARELDIVRCAELVRTTDEGDAIDVALVARRAD